MTDRIYPRKVWVLQPSFRPIEVQIVKPYVAYGSADYGDISVGGRIYRLSEMHMTKAAAIAAGRARLAEQRAKLDKQMVSLAKRELALNKAEGATP